MTIVIIIFVNYVLFVRNVLDCNLGKIRGKWIFLLFEEKINIWSISGEIPHKQ